MGDERKVYWNSAEEWWQRHIPEIESCFAEKVAKSAGFDQLHALFDESGQAPRVKSLVYVAMAILARNETKGNLPYKPLKKLYLLAPINHETGVWLTTAMHIARDVPREELPWLNSRACPCSALEHGFSSE